VYNKYSTRAKQKVTCVVYFYDVFQTQKKEERTTHQNPNEEEKSEKEKR